MMKKVLVLGALGLLLNVPSNVMAQQAGGYTGPSATIATSVAEAVKMTDGAVVELTGKIEKSLGDEKYTFRDQTGTVKVEIDNEDFRGVSVNEQEVVKLRGEVDKDLLEETIIDVDSVEKVQ